MRVIDLKHLFFILLIISCTQRQQKTKQPQPKTESKVFIYFKGKDWSYPIQIDFRTHQKSTSGNYKNEQIPNFLDTSILKRSLLSWCKKDSLFKKNNEAIRISNFHWEKIDKSSSRVIFDCIVDFYKEGEIRDGVVLPVEGHGIIDNKFLFQREKAFFDWSDKEMRFLRWYN